MGQSPSSRSLPTTTASSAAAPSAARSASAAPAAAASRFDEGAASIPSAPSISQRCHTDALHCVFAFLRLKELLPALHSCREWHAAGCKEPSRRQCIVVAPDSVPGLAASPLRHHAAELTVQRLQFAQLCHLRSLPRLTALDMSLAAADLAAQLQPAGRSPSPEQQTQLWRDVLPLRLRTLTLGMQSLTSHSIRQSLLDALPSLPALHALRLEMGTDELDLSPLLRLPQLRDLYLYSHPSQPQCAVIKQLSTLTSLQLSCSTMDPDALLRLLTPPHSLQLLQRLPGRRVLNLAALSALHQLPALTELSPIHMKPECWAGLSAFTPLRSLHLDWADPFTAAQQSSLESALNSLPHLSDLELCLANHSYGPGAAPLCLRLPALRRLILDSFALLSTSFLQQSPLLERLELLRCKRMSAEDLLGFLRAHPPAQLKMLILAGSVSLSDEQQAALRPPSALLPSLVHFFYVLRV
jgi:hypothetical protein